MVMFRLVNEKNISKIVKFVFLIYLFFIFFGTSMPFRERATSVDDVATSNIMNQIIFTFLFLMSCALLIPKRKEVVQVIKIEKFLTLFLIWCVFSILWSNYPIVSFKRLFQLISSVMVILSFLLYIKPGDESLRYFKLILYLYIPLSFLSILFIPGAIDPVHLTWRGLSVGKNYLGQVAVVSIIIWAYAIKKDSWKGRTLSVMMLILSIVLLFGAWSMTSILTFAILLCLFLMLSIDRKFKLLGVGKTFFVTVMISVVIIAISIYYLGYDIIVSSFRNIGKDITFTGRTDLWIDLLKIAKPYLHLGYGYGSFWVIQYDNVDLMNLYEKYIWLPNEAHLGYLDILIETGFVGLILFILMITFYFINLITRKKQPFGLWLMIAILILNLQESTIFFPKILTGELFIFSYLVLYADLFRQNYPS